MRGFVVYIALAVVTATANAALNTETWCTYAPSKSNVLTGLSAGAGGASAATAAVATALGLSVVTHSSGALILTGGSGYIAGTIGAAAATGPAIVVVGATVAGAAVTVELLCLSKNYPGYDEKIAQTYGEFSELSRSYWKTATDKAGPLTNITAAKLRDLKTSTKEASGRGLDYAREAARSAWEWIRQK